MNPRGVTLVEVSVSTVLVGVMLVASLQTLQGALRAVRNGSDTISGHAVAASLISEILTRPYEDPDGNSRGIGIEADEPSSPSTRLAFDDVDDYDGWTQELNGWKRSVKVTYLEEKASSRVLVETEWDAGMKQISVRCINSEGTEVTLVSLRSAHGPAEAVEPFDTTRSVVGTVEIETSGSAVLKATVLPNTPEAP